MRVQNAVSAVRAFPSKGELRAQTVEICAPLDQFFNSLRRILNQSLGSFNIAEPIAGVEGILQMQAYFVFIAQRGGDAALCELRVGIGHLALGKNRHASRRRQLNGGAQAGHSRPDNQEICSGRHRLHGKTVPRVMRKTVFPLTL